MFSITVSHTVDSGRGGMTHSEFPCGQSHSSSVGSVCENNRNSGDGQTGSPDGSDEKSMKYASTRTCLRGPTIFFAGRQGKIDNTSDFEHLLGKSPPTSMRT
ncbi:hypothetical protein NPIL_194081 [Nephila pilipes]|uniref:Uncharacterized protein n=1 Tax=Nephila pilipes TaxID=299642 RepID=A0A8X6T626_NEPPI|nr:hypothetical protein NPIL_194081 [Nephila pilipes]